MTKKLYSTSEIEVSWEPDLCIHSGKCVLGSYKVFNPRRRPWVELAIVANCPSGALKARRLDAGETGRNEEGTDPRVGGLLEAPGQSGAGTQSDPRPVITASKNGPLRVEFACVVKDADGKVIREVSKASLCRCGQSNNKPFCDGTHSKVGFQG